MPGTSQKPKPAGGPAGFPRPSTTAPSDEWRWTCSTTSPSPGLRPAVLVADTGYGANAAFRHGLDERGHAWVLQVKGEMTAHGQDAVPHQPDYGPARFPAVAPARQPCASMCWLLDAAAVGGVTLRKGSKAAMNAHFVLLRIHLAGRRPKPAADGTILLVWLIAQWPEGEAEPVKYWISNLPADIPAPARRPRHRRSPVPDRTAERPKSPCQGLTLYQALDLLQHLVATWNGTCPTCRQPTPWQPYDTT
ncbi:transposase [Streptomyces zhihengii]|uniref:transposase n=1 Tax=Streptomyces zhihengii TaxID=1818004 RepID=UPI0033B59C96